jgi:BASS family bile acid:Na+ symporter
MSGTDPTMDIAVPALVWLLMLAVGLDLESADLRRVLRYPKTVAIATLGQLLALPAFAAVLIWTLEPGPITVAGIVLLAASPGGALSNTYSYLSRANLALSVTLTAVSTLLALVAMPLLTAAGFALFLHEQASIPIPVGRMVAQLSLMLLLPLALGMALRRWRPEAVRRADRGLRRLSLLAVGLILGAILYARRSELASGLPETAAAALGFILLAMGAGWTLGWLVGLDGRDRFTLLLEFAVRNVALVALIGVSVLGRPELVLFAAVFLLLELPIALALVWAYARHQGRETNAPGLLPDKD